ncbi:MAG: class I SAM-dependent methyltransferase [Anaerolineae bacterium]|nr:class I SAM-dependent methyltransferase [Anaerolineae bacterium]MBT7069323.1 class I SAM-dependent methyltransferase [Anaerolineae bacterium]MBT7325961.1 class I SAM-dependent methyltransferase [Anaerolineae bacterium]
MNPLISNLFYLSRPPWDSGITPPELLEFIDQHPAGRAIDIGCGTGTNLITLAEHGWQVSGVDFALLALYKARRKAKIANVKIDLHLGDASKLRGIKGKFDLALDMGCFHNLGEKKRDYLAQLDNILAPSGYWLIYAHLTPADGTPASHGLAPVDLASAQSRFDLIWRKDGTDKIGRDSVWALFQKK